MVRFAAMRNIEVWYTRLDVAGILEHLGSHASRKQMKRLQSNVAKMRTKDSLRALTKLCQTVDGELRIVGNPPLVTPIEDVLPGAEQDHLEDVARRMMHTYIARFRTTGGTCSRATGTCTPPERWSVSEASVRAPGSC